MANAIVRFLARRFSDTIRGVDTLIWALIWINVVGLGPFAGRSRDYDERYRFIL